MTSWRRFSESGRRIAKKRIDSGKHKNSTTAITSENTPPMRNSDFQPKAGIARAATKTVRITPTVKPKLVRTVTVDRIRLGA